MPRNIVLTVLFAIALPMLHSGAEAQDRKVEQAIKHRRAAFTLMSTYVNRMVQTVEGDRPFDARQILADANAVEQLSRLPWEGFIAGSERGNSRASEDIWLDEDQFKKLSTELEARATALAKTAQLGDFSAFKPVFERMRNTCSACHKAFRTE